MALHFCMEVQQCLRKSRIICSPAYIVRKSFESLVILYIQVVFFQDLVCHGLSYGFSPLLVRDFKARGEIGCLAVFSEYIRTEAVNGAYFCVGCFGAFPSQFFLQLIRKHIFFQSFLYLLLYSGPELCSSCFSKGDYQKILYARIGFSEISHKTLCEHLSLSASGSGGDQNGTIFGAYCSFL